MYYLPNQYIYYPRTLYPFVNLLWMIPSETVDFFTLVCYIRFSDRVAETCEARDRGRACGSLPLLLYRGEYYDEKNICQL